MHVFLKQIKCMYTKCVCAVSDYVEICVLIREEVLILQDNITIIVWLCRYITFRVPMLL